MSRKLLKEETVSKFMKLANIDGERRQHFLKENFVAEELEEDQEGLEEYGLGSELEEKETIDIGELGLEEETFGLGEAEEEGDEGDEDDVGSLEMSAEEAKDAIGALTVVLDKLKLAVGEEAEAEVEAEPELEEPMAEPEADLEAEPEAEMPELEPEAEEEVEERMYEGKKSQEELVNKIAKRVAARLLKESKK